MQCQIAAHIYSFLSHYSIAITIQELDVQGHLGG